MPAVLALVPRRVEERELAKVVLGAQLRQLEQMGVGPSAARSAVLLGCLAHRTAPAIGHPAVSACGRKAHRPLPASPPCLRPGARRTRGRARRAAAWRTDAAWSGGAA